MKEIIVLGGGMVGSAMALDLAKEYAVTVADQKQDVLLTIQSKNVDIKTCRIDASNSGELSNAITPYDLVICAVPGFLGFQTLSTIIQSGKDVVDISFFPEDALSLNDLAKQKGVTAVVDCGVAPGMGNIILGYHNEKMNVTHFECMVGGLPMQKSWPFNYKAPFSPIDVIEEYTRPARYIENGHLVTKEALSDCELVEFEHVGTLEAFNSDGLRSLIYTMPHIPNMKEKTLRYPGHVDQILALKKSGFFNTHKIQIGKEEFSPLEFTSRILFDNWKLGEEEEEFTVMRIKIGNEEEEVVYDLFDRFDIETKTSSMARTTGYTATAVANLILQDRLKEKGVLPPELVGKTEEHFRFIMDYLEKRRVYYKKALTKLT